MKKLLFIIAVFLGALGTVYHYSTTFPKIIRIGQRDFSKWFYIDKERYDKTMEVDYFCTLFDNLRWNEDWEYFTPSSTTKEIADAIKADCEESKKLEQEQKEAEKKSEQELESKKRDIQKEI